MFNPRKNAYRVAAAFAVAATVFTGASAVASAQQPVANQSTTATVTPIDPATCPSGMAATSAHFSDHQASVCVSHDLSAYPFHEGDTVIISAATGTEEFDEVALYEYVGGTRDSQTKVSEGSAATAIWGSTICQLDAIVAGKDAPDTIWYGQLTHDGYLGKHNGVHASGVIYCGGTIPTTTTEATTTTTEATTSTTAATTTSTTAPPATTTTTSTTVMSTTTSTTAPTPSTSSTKPEIDFPRVEAGQAPAQSMPMSVKLMLSAMAFFFVLLIMSLMGSRKARLS